LIETVTAALNGAPRLKALFLGGGPGKGEGDAYGDVDLIAVTEPDERDAFVADWQAALQSIAPVVFWNRFGADDRRNAGQCIETRTPPRIEVVLYSMS